MLGRFIQPDSIVPEPGNPQSLNRYSYVLNNPLRYTDPTGHRCVDAIENVDCSLFKPSKFAPTSVPPRFRQLRAYAGIAFLASQTDQWWGSTLSPQEAMGMMLYIEVGILIEQDANGNWYLPDAVMEAATRRYNEYCSGGAWSGSCMGGFWNYFEPIRNAHRYFNPSFLVDLRSEYDGFFLEAADQIINSPEVGGIRPDRPSGWGTILQGNPVYQKALEVDGNIGSRSNQAFFTKGYYGGNNPGVFVVVSENQQAHLCGTNQYGPLSCIQ